MIVASTKLQLLVVIPDPSSNRGRLVEIERCARDGLQLPGWNQAFVDGGELAGLDSEVSAVFSNPLGGRFWLGFDLFATNW